ncbi:MAG: hypothetical protein M3N41_02985 [Acidobacteriota bacterium]|nr:hypothetical protein [Acidobacteriota bacterium]
MEHNGRQFPLTKLGRKNYQLRGLTGFALEGKHSHLSCEQCHNASHISEVARSEIKMKDLNKTFLGLGRECVNCHQDPHAGQLGPECLRCHNQDVWKPAEGFNHSRTSFPLTGLHQNVACARCHGPKPGEPPRITRVWLLPIVRIATPIPTQRLSGCIVSRLLPDLPLDGGLEGSPARGRLRSR